MTIQDNIIVLAHRLAADAECELSPDALADLRLQAKTLENLIEAEEMRRALTANAAIARTGG